MTSEEIKNQSRTFPHPESDGFWLKEIAYQLARLNELARESVMEGLEQMAKVPIGWRCGSCNYSRNLADVNLTAKGYRSLERGICPSCGKVAIQLVFSKGA